jgi:hypothetical protein
MPQDATDKAVRKFNNPQVERDLFKKYASQL